MSTLPHIKTVVMLMLENWSLDMMLGWLHRDGLAVNLVPSDSHPPHFDGIPADAVNYRSSWPGEPAWAHRNSVLWSAASACRFGGKRKRSTI